ncbi:4-amino-4-deoxy-L-arabinose transferase-like glycosyltransferase [Novosphingobium chloroacetimidivorans]|uniref:4-amino-4-deoxy-L-arabinose transferase-like glycosyltransferase n=1 Tax=Novosphingobium chloroacetimidivorans TaxID=1428314 RepID=A0A7W7K7Y2_9SPHN|nr:glycosyltransferase family 39 protein [Novosphingobium chloroacetimidivorans]MBB4857892.1 4-amino-4-deoxy-L-arabinose transferase-like glycosyltransferase [Novosphingobium chloroacetimidivorans]
MHETRSTLLDRFATSPRALWAIWSVFIGLRLLVLLIPVAPSSDAEWYVLRATSLAAGQGYLDNAGQPTAFWPAGWPMAMSVLFRVTGPSLLALGLFNLASAVLTGWLALALGRRLFGSEAAARIGLLLLAIYPNAIGYVPLGLTEVFYTALLLLGCWLVIARKSALWLVGAGLVFGFATLVKAQTLVMVPLLFAIDWLRAGDVWRRLPKLIGHAALVLGVAALTVLPWTLRNHAQLGHWVAVSTNGGFTLLTGNNDSATGDYTPDDTTVTALMARRDLNEVSRDAEAKRLGLQWIAEHPGRFVALAPRKLMRLWLPDGEAEWAYQAAAPSYPRFELLYRAVRVANQAYYMLLMLGFAAAFVAMTIRRRAEGQRWVGWWLVPWGVALYPSLIAVVFSGQSRFHYPVMPFVCLACGWLAADLLARFSQTRHSRESGNPSPALSV